MVNLTGGDRLVAGFLWGFLDAVWLSLGTFWVTISVSSLCIAGLLVVKHTSEHNIHIVSFYSRKYPVDCSTPSLNR